ncbi:MAG TPA: XdhC/CoxI family protein [Acidimicrobiales bacterium]|jgi:xanthine dehydrogenase accessory factor|nr:XdhC/CoxI family protein [Acidimicrobiales bacterium]
MNSWFGLVRDSLRAGNSVALATVVEVVPPDGGTESLPPLGAKLVVRPGARPAGSLGDDDLDRVVVRDVEGALEAGRSVARHYGPHGEARRTNVTVFIEVFAPPRRMFIFGAVDFTGALVRMAKVLGYHVTVCDARPAFATEARFPEADEVVVDWPHRFLAKVGESLGPLDAICVLTHDHKFDVPALLAALDTRVGYLGAMGSRATHAGRIRLLEDEGVDPERIQQIMSPIGIDIGASTPEETAVSICAEIISRRAGVPAPSLRDRTGPIHRAAS